VRLALVPHNYNNKTAWEFNTPEGGKVFSFDLKTEDNFAEEILQVLTDHDKGDFDLGNFALIEEWCPEQRGDLITFLRENRFSVDIGLDMLYRNSDTWSTVPE
jgi:hypothetical protein